MDLNELIDRQQVHDLIVGYTRAIDTARWDDLDALFAEGAVLDYASSGGPVGSLAEAKPFIANLTGFTRWQHMLGQVAIDVDGDRAQGTAYFINPLVATRPDGSEQLWEVGGYYHLEAQRAGNDWLLTRLVDELVWSRTD